jgi:hypothetical protein
VTAAVPSPWEFALLALAVYRVFRLIAEDTILDRPRAWLLGVPGYKPSGYETPPPGFREHLATWLTCPWCSGAWLSAAAWVAWLVAPGWTVWLAVPWALSGVVALVAARLDPA